ncbi:MAG: sulfotransferase family protein [Cyclobacteriaceae bacterium]|nr:sulfotransferase family protein [Cyclobacteriaceae bacterium]
MIINLISSPRNISTALMYSFAQRQDIKVVDEPFYAYYLWSTGLRHPGRDEILKSQPTSLLDVVRQLDELANGNRHIFVKNMAHHLVGQPMDFLSGYRNVFLIRDPKQLIASFTEVIPQPTMQDIGSRRQAELYDWLGMQQDCPVIDSNEVLKNPKNVLGQLCEKLGIPFDENMLHWQPGPLPEDGVWARYWYGNVHQSKGFSRQQSSERPLPEACLPLFREAWPYYENLYRKAIKAED